MVLTAVGNEVLRVWVPSSAAWRRADDLACAPAEGARNREDEEPEKEEGGLSRGGRSVGVPSLDHLLPCVPASLQGYRPSTLAQSERII